MNKPMQQHDICILCKANPSRSCDCRNPKPKIQYAEKSKLVDELEDIKLTGTWDIHYTSVDRQSKPPRCLVRSDGVMVYATLLNQETEYSRWGVGNANKAGQGGRLPACQGHFKTAKEAMAWVDANIVERDRG